MSIKFDKSSMRGPVSEIRPAYYSRYDVDELRREDRRRERRTQAQVRKRLRNSVRAKRDARWKIVRAWLTGAVLVLAPTLAALALSL